MAPAVSLNTALGICAAATSLSPSGSAPTPPAGHRHQGAAVPQTPLGPSRAPEPRPGVLGPPEGPAAAPSALRSRGSAGPCRLRARQIPRMTSREPSACGAERRTEPGRGERWEAGPSQRAPASSRGQRTGAARAPGRALRSARRPPERRRPPPVSGRGDRSGISPSSGRRHLGAARHCPRPAARAAGAPARRVRGGAAAPAGA